MQTNQQQNQNRKAGFTLTEAMVTSAILGISVSAMLMSHLYGLKQDQLVSAKIGSSEQARESFNDLGQDIRAAKIWQIGNVNSSGNFVAIPSGTAQQGTAVRVHLTTNTNTYYLYYFDTNSQTLYRTHSGWVRPKPVASHLTNSMCFRAEDPRGNLLTNITHKGVIATTMQFSQYQYPLTKIGPSYFYNYYALTLKLTPHVPDGP